MAVNYVYALNVGTADSYTGSINWAARWQPDDVFTDVSVNPVFKNPNGNTGFGDTCANFFEIRKAPTDVGATVEPDISNNSDSRIVNRIIPSSNPNVLNNYATNKQETQSHKIRCYDTTQTTSGQKIAGSSAPNSGLDLDNIDFFVLINPEVTDETTPKVRPHFAKIKQIVAYDEYGDGFEFEPKYPTSIPEGTNFEIYQGPAVTNTNIVAVSYGLRGDSTVSSTLNKFEVWNKASTPNWYFYSDRLENKNQLNYDTKYMLTSCRWFSDWASWGGTGAAASSPNMYIGPQNLTTSGISWNTTNNYGNSVWIDVQGAKKFIGNITTTTTNQITVDQIREYNMPTNGTTLYKGRTIHQTVFLTTKEYGTAIMDLGRFNQDAVLVDNIRNTANDYDNTTINYTEDPSYWKDAIRNYSRSIVDKTSEHTSYTTNNYTLLHGNLTGPRRFLYYKSADRINNGITNIMNQDLNLPFNKISQLASIKSLDETGIKHLKFKADTSMYVRPAITTGNLDEFTLPYKVHTETTSGYNFILQELSDGFNCRNANYLQAGDIMKVKGIYYRISTVGSPSTSLKTQAITVDKQKTDTEGTWSSVTSLPVLTALSSDKDKTVTVRAWGNRLTGDIPIDTQGVFNSSSPYALKRLTLNGRTITKSKANLYNDRVVLLNKQFIGIDIPIDYGDSVNKFVKLQEPNKTFYVPSGNVSFLHYVSGNYAIEEQLFKGSVEDISSNNENGTMVYSVTGRDELAKLLDNTVNKNLQRTEDIIYSSLNPMIDFDSSLCGTWVVAAAPSSGLFIRVTDAADTLQVLQKYDLVFDASGNLIGEVDSAVDYTTGGVTQTLITFTHPSVNAFSAGSQTLNFVQLNSQKNYLTGLKAMGANIQENSYATDLSDLGDNGVAFINGLKSTYAANGSQTLSTLINTSSTEAGLFSLDGSMGYDISKIRGHIRTKDSNFAFKVGKEDDAGITHNTINTASSMTPFSIVDENTKEESNTVYSMAPNFPLVLGSIELNAADTLYGGGTGTGGIYLLNNRLPKGGYLHKLTSTHTGLYTSNVIFKYSDLHEFGEGSIIETYDSIYNDNLLTQKITGYCPILKINGKGTITALTAQGGNNNAVMGDTTQGLLPERESNFWTGTHLGLTSREAPIGNSTWQKGPNVGADGIPDLNYDGSGWSALENIDYRCKNYEILSLGDLYPDSKLRHNNIGFSANANSFTDFGLLLEGKGIVGTSVSHTNYTGNTTRTIHTDSDYDRMAIQSASITPSQMRRFGIARLIETTYDWHFNPIDYESTPETNKIPKLWDNTGDYHRWQIIYSDKSITTYNGSNTWTLNAQVSLLENDIIYGPDGRLWFRITNTISNSNSLVQSTNATPYHTEASMVGNITIMRPKLFYRYSDDGFGLNTMSTSNEMKMLNCYLAIPTLARDYLKQALLRSVGNPSVNVNAHNVWFPMFSSITGGSSTDLEDYYSAFHEANDWSDVNIHYHPSRVINAITQPTFGATNDGIQYKIHGNEHPYEGCHMLFKDFNKSTKQNKDNEAFEFPSSAYMGQGTDDNWAAYWVKWLVGSPSNDQHNRFLRVNHLGSPDAGSNATTPFAIIGTTTAKNHLSASGINMGSREYDHTEVSGSGHKGDIISAQTFFKPKFTLSSINSDTLTFTLNGSSNNSWLDFVPNLTNQYLVSDKLEGTNKYLPTADKINTAAATFYLEGHPTYIGKIIAHYVDTSGTHVVHKITLDKTLNTTTHGNTFRVMRISETTFKDTPDLFDINKMVDTGLTYKYQTQNFITGDKEIGDPVVGDSTSTGVSNKDLIYEEGLFSMYLVLDVDTIHTYPDRRTIADAKTLFTNEESIECYITDGTKNETKNITVQSDTSGLRLKYDGTLTQNGLVSFGELFTITAQSRPKLRNAKNAYIGTTFVVGTDAESAIESVLEENDIDVDTSERNLTFTNNIVSSVNGTTITLETDALDVIPGNLIYNQDGKFIGKINTVSTDTITLSELDSGGADIAYTPIANDEITLYDRKPLILSSSFNDLDAFSTINFLASKKGLEYQFKNDKMEIKSIADFKAKGRFSLAYNDASNLLEVKSNTTLFDKANKIVVVGDNVKAEVVMPTDKKTKTIKVIDENIKQVSEAKIKAEQLLTLHNQDAKKITLKMNKAGYELMKPGDLITLDFPNHNVPRTDYTVFEIENAMSSVATITVGTFNKTIAERLTEMSLKQQSGFGTLFTKNSGSAVKIHYEFEKFNLRENSLKYQITSPTGMVVGWTTTVGFISAIGLGTDTVTTAELKV